MAAGRGANPILRAGWVRDVVVLPAGGASAPGSSVHRSLLGGGCGPGRGQGPYPAQTAATASGRFSKGDSHTSVCGCGSRYRERATRITGPTTAA